MNITTFKGNIPFKTYFTDDKRIQRLIMTWENKVPDEKFLNFVKFNKIKYSQINSDDYRVIRIKNMISELTLDELQNLMHYTTDVLIKKQKKASNEESYLLHRVNFHCNFSFCNTQQILVYS